MLLIFSAFESSALAFSDLPKTVRQRLSNAVVLYIGSPIAYVNTNKTFVDTSNNQVCPLSKSARTLVPVRFISESIGADVKWDGKTQTVIVIQQGRTVKLTLGSKKIFINNKPVIIDVPAESINERTFLPLRALVESLGKKVLYYNDLIIISDNEKIISDTQEQDLLMSIIALMKPIAGVDDFLSRGSSAEGTLFKIVKAASDGTKRYGFINRAGREVIKPIFAMASEFYEGLALVKDVNTNKFGYINNEGVYLISAKFEYAYDFYEGMAKIRQNGKYGFINKAGTTLIKPSFDYAYDFHEGIAVIKKDKKYGYIDKTGKAVIPLQFDSAYDFYDGAACVRVQNKFGYIDKTGTYIIPPQYDEASYAFREGLACVKIGTQYGCIDKSGNVIIAPTFNTMFTFHEGLACVKFYDGYGFIDKTGKIAIPARFSDCQGNSGEGMFREGLAKVKEGGLWGYIDYSGNYVIKPQYTEAGDFRSGVAYIQYIDQNTGISAGYGYITRSGSLIWMSTISK